jgi:hypothetical protein
MTAKTSENLAQVLHSAGLFDLERKARADAYHDFLSDDAMCSITLERDLRDARDAQHDPILKQLIESIRLRHLNGEFDASADESEEWAASPEGQATFGLLVGDLKGGGRNG